MAAGTFEQALQAGTRWRWYEGLAILLVPVMLPYYSYQFLTADAVTAAASVLGAALDLGLTAAILILGHRRRTFCRHMATRRDVLTDARAAYLDRHRVWAIQGGHLVLHRRSHGALARLDHGELISMAGSDAGRSTTLTLRTPTTTVKVRAIGKARHALQAFFDDAATTTENLVTAEANAAYA